MNQGIESKFILFFHYSILNPDMHPNQYNRTQEENTISFKKVWITSYSKWWMHLFPQLIKSRKPTSSVLFAFFFFLYGWNTVPTFENSFERTKHCLFITTVLRLNKKTPESQVHLIFWNLSNPVVTKNDILAASQRSWGPVCGQTARIWILNLLFVMCTNTANYFTFVYQFFFSFVRWNLLPFWALF